MSLLPTTIWIVRRDNYDDAIKAFARLAIGAGAEPRRVREQLGPPAICDTSAARRKSLNDLLDEAERATQAAGVAVNFKRPPKRANTREIYSPDVCQRLAEYAIECGMALRDMAAAWPDERQRLKLIANSSNVSGFESIGAERLGEGIHALQKVISHHLSALQRSHETLEAIELLKRCRTLTEALNRHDTAARTAYANATRFGPGEKSNPTLGDGVEHSGFASLRSIRDTSLSQSATIRRWVIDIAPGPL
jgi:hypothetical protein